jgi:hypothetical protein
VKQSVRPFLKSSQDIAEETSAMEMDVFSRLLLKGEFGKVAVGKAGA